MINEIINYIDDSNGNYIDQCVDAAFFERQIEQLLPQRIGQLEFQVVFQGPFVICVITLLTQGQQLLEHSLQRQSLQSGRNSGQASGASIRSRQWKLQMTAARRYIVIIGTVIVTEIAAGIVGALPLVDAHRFRFHREFLGLSS